jgi:hypothetical protein
VVGRIKGHGDTIEGDGDTAPPGSGLMD